MISNNKKLPLNVKFIYLFIYLFIGFLRQGFSIALEPILELALIDQADLDNSQRSAASVLGLKVCTTTARNIVIILIN